MTVDPDPDAVVRVYADPASDPAVACPKGFVPAPHPDRTWGECWTVCAPAADPPSADRVSRPSFIIGVRVLKTDLADGYRLRVVSQRKSSSCTRYGGYRTQRTGPYDIEVTVFHYARYGPGVVCTKDMVTDVTVVPLGSSFEPGTKYTITVNDSSLSFVAGLLPSQPES